MGDGISNSQIEIFFLKDENEDLKKNFIGVFSMDYITRFIKFHELIKEKTKGKYPFAIFNTDPHNKPGRHWWSFLDIQPKSTLLLFDSHGLEGFKYFIVDNDEKIIDKLLYNFENCKIDDANTKINLCTMTFDTNVWDKLPKNKKSQLNETATYFFHLLYQFAKLKQSKQMKIVIVETNLQELKSSTCGIFQLYFYKNLFDPSIKSNIIEQKVLNTSTVQILLNEIFTSQTEENERRVKLFKQEFLQ